MYKVFISVVLVVISANANAERVWTGWFETQELWNMHHGAFLVIPPDSIKSAHCPSFRWQENINGSTALGVKSALSTITTAFITKREINIEYENSDPNCFSYNVRMR
jgi:hypothetical protein